MGDAIYGLGVSYDTSLCFNGGIDALYDCAASLCSTVNQSLLTWPGKNARRYTELYA